MRMHRHYDNLGKFNRCSNYAMQWQLTLGKLKRAKPQWRGPCKQHPSLEPFRDTCPMGKDVLAGGTHLAANELETTPLYIHLNEGLRELPTYEGDK
mmetsp:Transcript_75160/g.189174  ORF Transcript_75160/g.189174 Transcript_75160/m.189174 type:complete len:96 (+) Transcript_75160:68-355(+)